MTPVEKAHDDIITWVLSFLGFIVMNCSELTKCVLFPLFSILSRSKDETELESSSLASENAEKMHPEYSRELETLCEELQATLDGLVRSGGPQPGLAVPESRGRLCPGAGSIPRRGLPLPSPRFCLSLLTLPRWSRPLYVSPESCFPRCCAGPSFLLSCMFSGRFHPLPGLQPP